ncbi:transporter [Salinimicrobium marinum]|uniref:Transporter n=1 Tax=Salinimicrobium marinum TaxID=680283 RepID=A0A918S6Y1_9FLAO|nr:TolC family protein [Salinimicrobium marinum]GHA23686.1 transporter [Salinimicrobium marinum]
MKKLTALLFILFSLNLAAQETQPQQYSLSLEEAVALGLERNYSARNAQKDIEIALKQKWEIIAQGLPQLDATVDYRNNLIQPLSVLPGELIGEEPGTFVALPFSPKHNVTATSTWNQLIFDGSYIVGIQSAKTLLQISRNAKTKTDQEVKSAVINAYGNVLLANESLEILNRNLSTLQKNYDETKAIFENGMAEEEDVEQLEISLLGLNNNLNRTRRMRDIAYEMLNTTLGIPVELEVTLTEDLEDLAMKYYDLGLLEENIPVEENIDYRIAKNTAESAEIQVKLQKAAALPTLTGYVNFGYQAFDQEFNFFSSDQEYYNQSILGVTLNIPILSSGMRGARTQQRKIELEQALLDLEQTENEVKLEINSAKNEYEFSLENLETQRRNLELAERIENKNQIKFFEGLASSFELNEARIQLYTAQQDYLQAMLDVITAKVELENLLDTTEYNEN